MSYDEINPMVITAAAVFFIGLGFLIYVLRKESLAERNPPAENGKVKLDVGLEYDKTNGALFYVLENTGDIAAHDVRVYLPGCHDTILRKPGPNSANLAAAILKVGMMRHDRISAGDRIEVPLLQVPPTDATRKEVYKLGIDVEMRWSNSRGDISIKEFVLPIASRIGSPAPAYA